MTLTLDDRQRAMLAEMGIRVFLLDSAHATDPAPVSAAAPAPVAKAPLPSPAAPRVQPAPAPVPAPAMGEPVAAGPVPLMDWSALESAVSGCEACPLCRGRTQAVFGVGDRKAEWMVIGEAPGEQEDLRGEPFVGPSGQLLDNMLRAVGVKRGQGVYIANVLKCRPPGNRNPQPDEIAQCEPFLRRQVELVQPRIILAMGRFAVQALLQSQEAIGKLRGRVHRYGDVPLVVTYHPAYLLRNLADKARAWDDLCLARRVLQGSDAQA